MDGTGTACIADFGLSIIKLHKTRAYPIVYDDVPRAHGTLRWMAPEQLKGIVTVPRAADIYSFAVTIYEVCQTYSMIMGSR